MPSHSPFLRSIRRRSRLVAACPWLSRVGELRQLLAASRQWRRNGWFVPVPYFVRRAMLLAEARRMGAEMFVETGTYKGGTIWSLRNDFRRLVTIEVVPELAALARERFARLKHVEVIQGDSAKLLPGVCDRLDAPALLYLDGHYSGGVTGMGEEECPVLRELDAVFNHARVPFAIVIDDARLFGTDPAYPTLDALTRHVQSHRRGMAVRVENDAVLIHGAGSGDYNSIPT